MTNNVGRAWFFWSLLIISSCAYGTVTLKVKDFNGIPLKEVVAGYPCKIELTIDGAQRRMENPEIKGLSQFHLEGRETSMQMINGTTSVTYGFRARCTKPGSYTIGPAELSIEGKKYSSNVITITVVAAPATRSSDKKEDVTAFARLRCAKKQVVVGEKIGMNMRFYYTNHDHIVRDVGNPPEQGYTRKNIQGPFAGTESVDGVMHHYIEWTWDVYPTGSGTLVIPAYSFDYDTPKADGQDHVFAGFSLFFNQQRYDHHRIYSNACEIAVDPVSKAHGDVQGVGHFSSFTARITPTQVQQGDGMVLTLELVGDADFDAITLAPLTMPAVFKWYDSQTSLAQDTQSTRYKKTWEYIVQGLKPGSYEIPAQQFTYFDTKKRTVVTLSTTPQSVSILASNSAAQTSAILSKEELQNKKLGEQEQVSDVSLAKSLDIIDPSGLKPIHESGQWYAQQERVIPFWLYTLLMMFPIGFISVRWLYNNKSGRVQRAARKRFLFKQARLHLERAERNEDACAVYPLFISLLSNCLSVPESMITDEAIEKALKQAGFDDAQCHAWKQFFVQATSYAFYTSDNHRIASSDFFKQAAIWLDIYEKKL